MSDDQGQRPESLLPYDEWTSDALRQVMVRALASVAAQGLPGEHHFYITFRTDAPGVQIPPRLKAQYPHEMTIVLQHQFWDLKVDERAGFFGVGLSFSGIPSPLHIPFAAVVAFADPHVRYRVRFSDPAIPEAPHEEEPPSDRPLELLAGPARDAAEDKPAEAEEAPQVVSLDAFRRRPPPAGRDQ
jgi:hypothetical protein